MYLYSEIKYGVNFDITTDDGLWAKQSMSFNNDESELIVSMLNTDDERNFLDIYLLDPADLTQDDSFQIAFSNCNGGGTCNYWNWRSHSIVDFPEYSTGDYYYHILVSGKGTFMLLVVPHDLIGVSVARVWETPSYTALYDVVGFNRLYSDSSLVFGANGQWTPASNSSSLIFRLGQLDFDGDNDVNDYSCVSFREVKRQDILFVYYDLYYEFVSDASGSGN